MISIAPGDTSAEIARRLQAAFAPSLLEVHDESDGHRGHGGHREGEQTHLAVRIEAAAFSGLTRVAAQRLVHKELADLMDPPVGQGPIHALTVSARAG